jgi:predicted CXXCH cytochrome family protein
MKKAIVALAIAAFASTAFAVVEGSSHDLNDTTGNPDGDYPNGGLNVCQYCHAPHNTNTGITGAPLWNRNTPDTASFTMYSSNTLQGAIAAQPNTNSITCLSCHDGVTDMGDTYTGTHGFGGTATPMVNTRGDVIGDDLSDDHPISVNYVAGPSFEAISVVTTAGLRLYGAAGSETVECASCHDPHDQDTNTKFLRAPLGEICTACHNK